MVNHCIGFSVSTSYNLKICYVSRSVCYSYSEIESALLNVYFDMFSSVFFTTLVFPTEVDLGLKPSVYPYIGSKVVALQIEKQVVCRLILCLY